MTPIAAPADKRFRRSVVSPARKRRWRPSPWALARTAAVWVVIGLVVYRTVTFVLASDALTVTRLTVEGHQRMSRGEVLGLLEGLTGSSIVTTDLETWRQKLLSSPWVADASIRRMFPGTLAVAIVERRPLGVGRIDGALYLVDESGAIIDEFGPNYADLDLPIIDGLAAPEAPAPDESARRGPPADRVDQHVARGIAGRTDRAKPDLSAAAPATAEAAALRDRSRAEAARAALAGRLLEELGRKPPLAARVSQIDVTDHRNAIVILKGDTALLQVGDERFADRLQSYLDLLPVLRDRMPDIDSVDLRFDERVYVKPQRGTRAAAAARRSARGARGG